MINVAKDARLTDELERQLMQQAIEEQYRFKPVEALKKLLTKLFAAADRVQTPTAGRVVESAS
ncbi:hypothetical protein [Pollutimonas harenae]|uniref:Uncharacterized protein n=1 Tax=Pollutimonas harenae TaxID=657015 RepID=A0A853GXV6_9BURK|nr:hypothetical protein [Pollutimonas harenae]NYT85576.1 hypothetical protein [Pollutimonas harenae]TEA70659.1 hypothetical protein ERD84_08245 [Pollutimonas harenae]